MNSPKRKAAYASLAEWREANGLTMREAGDVIGYSESGYFKLERGLRYAGGKDLDRIWKRTGVRLESLVGVA